MTDTPEKDNGQGRKYPYFVDNQPYHSDLPALTGAQIKARIPNFNPAYMLTLEGRGGQPDQIVRDTDVVQLEEAKGGPARLFTTPPATFGA